MIIGSIIINSVVYILIYIYINNNLIAPCVYLHCLMVFCTNVQNTIRQLHGFSVCPPCGCSISYIMKLSILLILYKLLWDSISRTEQRIKWVSDTHIGQIKHAIFSWLCCRYPIYNTARRMIPNGAIKALYKCIYMYIWTIMTACVIRSL